MLRREHGCKMKTYLSGNKPRITECFDFDWYFYRGEKEPVPGEHYVETGVGWYRKRFRLDKTIGADERIFLRFDGVYMLADVWVNGWKAGRHTYGYTPFEWDITQLLNGKNENNVIDVRVDNSAQPGSRWYSGSWIYRVKKAHILPYGVWLRQTDVTAERALMRIETGVVCENPDLPAPAPFFIETEIYTPQGTLCAKDKKKIPESGAATTAVCQEFVIDTPVLWSPETPFLYEAVTKLYQGDALLDEVHNRTGLRSAFFHKDRGFVLNGNRCKLNGVCLHHDGGCAGAAVPVEVWERRLHKLKEMGANAIRMAHNPPDPALLDLCDRMGFLVMDEAFDEWEILKGKEFGSNTHESRGYSEWYEKCHEEDLRAMLLRDRNHPCIVIWSIGNEVPDQQSDKGYLTARHLKQICRELDPERPVTQANDQICSEPCPAKVEFLRELDVVGYNYVGRWRNRAETFYDEDRRTYPEWCMTGTENGGTGGIRGEYPMEMPEKEGWWRRPYYSAPVESGKLLRYTMSHDYVAGDFMWTGIDYLGKAHWPERSSSAGILDTCGFEKDGYYFYHFFNAVSK